MRPGRLEKGGDPQATQLALREPVSLASRSWVVLTPASTPYHQSRAAAKTGGLEESHQPFFHRLYSQKRLLLPLLSPRIVITAASLALAKRAPFPDPPKHVCNDRSGPFDK